MPITVDTEKVTAVGDILNDKHRSLAERFRALFTLRNIGGHTAVDSIAACFNDPSALLKHELAYCLGQMQDTYAIPVLVAVLKDITQEPMVRHEAGMLSIFRVSRGPPVGLLFVVRQSNTQMMILIGCSVSCPPYFFHININIKDRNIFSQEPFVAD